DFGGHDLWVPEQLVLIFVDQACRVEEAEVHEIQKLERAVGGDRLCELRDVERRLLRRARRAPLWHPEESGPPRATPGGGRPGPIARQNLRHQLRDERVAVRDEVGPGGV